MTTSYLYITETSNYDETHRKAIDANLISKTMFDAGSKVDIANPNDDNVIIQLEIEKFDKDQHTLIINSKKYKVLNIVSKGDGSSNSVKTDVTKTPIADMSNLKTYDDFADLKPIVEELIKKNGKTSSLEVKEELRSRGFFAKQNMVSDSLQQVAMQSHGEIDLRYNGKFNEYFFAQPSATATQPSATSTPRAKKPRAKRNSLIITALWKCDLNTSTIPSSNVSDVGIAEIKKAIDNHQLQIPAGTMIDTKQIWVAYSPTRRLINLYDGDFTSDNVRGAFGKMVKAQFGDTFQTTRACRLKNIKNWKMA